MNTQFANTRWTRKEVLLAKEALKKANGNQKEASDMLVGVINRTLVSIRVKMCTLAKKHPSLRKNRIVKTKRVEQPTEMTTAQKDTTVITRIEWAADHIKLYF